MMSRDQTMDWRDRYVVGNRMPYQISRRESLYLDLLRVLAALTVLIDHASGLFDFPWSGGLGTTLSSSSSCCPAMSSPT